MTLGHRPEQWPYQTPLTIHQGALELGTGISVSLLRESHRIARAEGILHNHGIWRTSNLFPLVVGRNSPARIVCSPRGMLSSWSMQYKSVIKKPFWRLLQEPALKRCHCFHATAMSEYEDIRRQGFTAPVAVIPNGIDIPTLRFETSRTRRVVFLSRIDPKKGLDMLLPAWAAVAGDFTDWELVIAGPLGGNYARSMQNLAEEIRAPRIRFIGQVLGESKRDLLASASLFVLPTYSENFGIAVAEALAHGLPVITTDETPWTSVHERNCGWIIRPDQRELEQALRDAMSRSTADLHDMGAIGRSWMETDYAWRRIAIMMQHTYRWLLHGGVQPEWVLD